jgi:hypothetical protein
VVIISQNRFLGAGSSTLWTAHSGAKSPANVKTIEIIIIDDRSAAANACSRVRQVVSETRVKGRCFAEEKTK